MGGAITIAQVIMIALLISVSPRWASEGGNTGDQARWSRSRAVLDAESQISQDEIFVYVTGTIVCLPAVDSKDAQLAASLPTRSIACGCEINNLALRQAQVEYAKVFNRRIMQHVKSQSPDSGARN